MAATESAANREEALKQLIALPQKPEWLETYRRIAFDPSTAWPVRGRAVEAMSRSVDEAGTRLLLECLHTELYRQGLFRLRETAAARALAGLSTEVIAGLRAALERTMTAAETNFTERAIDEVNHVRSLLDGFPATEPLRAEAEAALVRLKVLRVPGLLQQAKQAACFEEVQEALRALERMRLPEADQALEEFRRSPSRLVRKIVGPALGARDESGQRQVYTSELGQTPCAEESAMLEARRRDWERRHPPAAPAAPASPIAAVEPEVESQNYVAATTAGIEAELLVLIDHQLPLMQSLHRHGSLAPIAAAMDLDGEIAGVAFNTRDTRADFGVIDALEAFRQQFKADAQAGRIAACATLYHGCHGPGRGSSDVIPAETVADADCLAIRLEHVTGQAILAVIQYARAADGTWRYAPAYYVPRRPLTFLDPAGHPLPGDHLTQASRRPARTSDRGAHPELMTLLENQMTPLKQCHREGSLAPWAAWLRPSGEIQSFRFVAPDAWATRQLETNLRDPVILLPEGPDERAPQGAIQTLQNRFRTAARAGEIVGGAVFFHAVYDAAQAPAGLAPAATGTQSDCIVAQLDHRISQAKSAIIRYQRTPDGEWHYSPAELHSAFPTIFNEV